MQKVKILLVEDDVIIGANLEAELEELGYVVTGNHTNSKEAITSFKEDEPDLLFLDIDLENSELDGIQIAEELNKISPKPIIYLTSFTDEATVKRAQKTKPANFLVKPSTKSQKKMAIELAISNFFNNIPAKVENPTSVHTENPGYVFLYNNFFFVKHRGQFVRVDIDDILWVKADGGSVEIITNKSKIITFANLSSFCRQVEHPNLIRIHRSYVINKHKVIALNNGSVVIVCKDKKENISIGPNYRPTIQEHFPMLRSD